MIRSTTHKSSTCLSSFELLHRDSALRLSIGMWKVECAMHPSGRRSAAILLCPLRDKDRKELDKLLHTDDMISMHLLFIEFDFKLLIMSICSIWLYSVTHLKYAIDSSVFRSSYQNWNLTKIRSDHNQGNWTIGHSLTKIDYSLVLVSSHYQTVCNHTRPVTTGFNLTILSALPSPILPQTIRSLWSQLLTSSSSMSVPFF